MNDKPEKETKTLPITKFCMTIGQLPTSYLMSMSYLEQVTWLCNFLEKQVIPALNQNGEAVKELQNLYELLRKYVNEYFDNLDVQEEINNKLEEMAESGELERIIDEYLYNLTEECKFIFPKNWTTGTAGSGDCGLIKCGGKNIMIDCSQSPHKSEVYQFLADYNIEHLDYFIVSHYDTDHTGNMISLINDGYIDVNTVIYLPPYVNYIANVPSALTNYNNIMNKLINDGIPYINPTENEPITITDSLAFTFFNCNASVLNASGWVRYNNYSMILLVKHQTIRALYTGDCNKEPLERLVNNQLLKTNVDLYKVEHHGYEFGINYTPSLLLKYIKPKYAWLPNSISMKYANEKNITLNYLKTYGTTIAAQFDNIDNVEFISNFNSIQLNGKPTTSISNASSNNTYYVDASTTNVIRNGSSTYPFKTLNEAVGAVSLNEHAIINVANGEYGDNDVEFGIQSLYLKNIDVTINGNSSDNSLVQINAGIKMYDSRLKLNNLTVHINTNNTAIAMYDSYIYTSNCIISGNSEEETKIGIGIDATDSKLHIITTTFKDLSRGTDNRNSDSFISNSTYENVSTANIIRNGKQYLSGNISYTNVTTRNNITSVNSIFIENPTLLFTGSADGERTLDLRDDITQYNHLDIQVGSYGTGAWTQYTLNSYQSLFNINDIFTIPTILGNATITITSSTTITIDFPTNSYLRKIDATRIIKN